MTEMMERIIAVIDGELGGDHESLSFEMGMGKIAPKLRREAMALTALAVVKAMREPTKEMLDEVIGRNDRIDRDPREYWAWMIDAILREPNK